MTIPHISTSEFICLNDKGWIPGPSESVEAFFLRISYGENLLENLKNEGHTELPFETNEQDSATFFEEAFQLTRQLYGIAPSWIPLFFSNYKLLPWHGGCAWIFQLHETTPYASFLQLRNEFKDHDTYLFFYERKELIAHEMAHAVRMMYQSPKFEEILAYQSSKNKLRQWWGGLIQSSTESFFFVLILSLLFFLDLALFATHSAYASTFSWSLKIIPLTLFCLATLRLWNRQRRLALCKKNLFTLYESETIAEHLTYRLTDEEIFNFSNLEKEKIKAWILNQASLSFRWEFLSKIYPLNN